MKPWDESMWLSASTRAAGPQVQANIRQLLLPTVDRTPAHDRKRKAVRGLARLRRVALLFRRSLLGNRGAGRGLPIPVPAAVRADGLEVVRAAGIRGRGKDERFRDRPQDGLGGGRASRDEGDRDVHGPPRCWRPLVGGAQAQAARGEGRGVVQDVGVEEAAAHVALLVDDRDHGDQEPEHDLRGEGLSLSNTVETGGAYESGCFVH